MAFLDKLKQITTGKTELERKQERAANLQIRKDVNAALLRTRREEAVKFAIEKEKLKYSQATKRLKQPKQYFGGFNVAAPEHKSYGSVTGKPRLTRTKKVKIKVGKGKKRKTVNRVIKTTPSYKFDSMFGSNRYGI